MTPDLTQNQLVGIVTAIVGTCLTSLFTTLVVLTWREQILEYLYRHGLLLRPRRRRQSPAPFPLHYILLYANSESTMDRPILEEQHLQNRTPYPPNSSDKFPQRPAIQPPQRNATPGPSNTRHTPLPPSTPTPEEANNRDLRARYDSFPPPKYDPNDLPPSERALLPIRPRALMAAPRAPAQRIFIRPLSGQFPANESSDESDGGFFGAVARRRGEGRIITITTDDENNLDTLELPLPDDDRDDSILHLPPLRRPDDPLNPDGLDYEWPELEPVDREILSPERSLAWEIRRDDVETSYPAWDGRPSSLLESSRIEIERDTAQTWAHDYMGPIKEERTRNRSPSRTHSRPSRDNWETAQTWREAGQNDFDHFHYDYNPYAEELPAAPFPLPDSPTQTTHHRPHHPRRLQGYHPPQYRTHPIAGQDPPDDEHAGGSDNPPVNTEEQREASEAAGRLLSRIAELEKELNDKEMRHRDHATKWGLPLRPTDKGKEPDHGRQPAHLPLPPNQYRPLWRRDNRYSVPRPPPDRGRPDPLPQPIGTADPAAPFMNI
ncbi:uncharacterized protein ARMOST_20082 [Armillaria ostoyae]|uniref:Uncharacterized protein n=1 Tax=Armillaria ostoyae TaxID=47428 RepID=A0A284S6G7_ARMOS|nr:uncharacterized protein ARMOST_20082 [Armillaria ostoyae]